MDTVWCAVGDSLFVNGFERFIAEAKCKHLQNTQTYSWKAGSDLHTASANGELSPVGGGMGPAKKLEHL